ncbi:MAG: Crp/Fnr family transcriptional regulator [Clostridia bacterium]|nr:Crp/Fnr family transcriptional regulator [Clostridia bacterium]
MFEKTAKKLEGSPLFQGIVGNDLISLLYCLEPRIRIYEKNQYITIAGDKFDSTGVVLEGQAMVNKENAAGNRIMMTMLKPGDMFGEVLVFSNQSIWPSTVQAYGNCKVLFLTKDKIMGKCEKICPHHKMIIQNMLTIVSEKALLLNRRVEYLTIVGIRKKISTFLIEQYKKKKSTTFTLPMNRRELAEFLNVSRPSLSREMCRMRDQDIIDFHMATIKIIDVEQLKKQI